MGVSSILSPFFPSVHEEITRDVPQEEFACNEGCEEFLGEVQRLADRRFGHGSKSNERLYLHYIQPPHGYTPEARAAVARQLQIQRQQPLARLDDFVLLSERRAFQVIVVNIRHVGGNLSPLRTGNILYVLGTLLHAYQDRKHMEGNRHPHADGITSREHFTTEIQQAQTDRRPPADMRGGAFQRSEEFLRRFREALQQPLEDGGIEDTPRARALKLIRIFRMEPGKKAYHYEPPPDVMNYVFPKYKCVKSPWYRRLFGSIANGLKKAWRGLASLF